MRCSNPEEECIAEIAPNNFTHCYFTNGEDCFCLKLENLETKIVTDQLEIFSYMNQILSHEVYITFRLPINGMMVDPFCSRMICLSASSSNELGIKCFIAGFPFSKFRVSSGALVIPGLNCLIRESLLLLGMRVAC